MKEEVKMKKKLIAVGLSLVLTLSMSITAMAASSSTSSNSGDQGGGTTTSAPAKATPSNPKPVTAVVEETKAGEAIQPAAVQVTIKSASGTVEAVTLDTVVEKAQTTVVTAVTASPTQAVVTIQEMMTTAPTPFFMETVQALAEMKGSSVVVNDCGTVKTAAIAVDALGNNIASAGVVKNVTSGALVMLMSVNEDGTIEYVEGVVDPVTGAVVGAFKGRPSVITVLVLA